MTPFLQLVAQDLCAKIGTDFSRTVIVFPNKRAGLFFNEYLLDLAGGQPVWAPRYVTLDSLFRSFARDWGVNDPIDTTLRIVQIFKRLTGRDVSVDWFYGWAEHLLADFDDVDKNRVDALKLYRNVNDWKQFDDTSFLSEQQVEDLKQFFLDFDPERRSELRERYRELWDVLGELYTELNAQLTAEHVAYEGALYRRVVEMLERGEAQLDPTVDRYVIVGFNALNAVEHSLFRFLKKEGQAMFYWDYDEYYTAAGNAGSTDPARLYNEAGNFIRRHLLEFPNELPAGDLFRNLAKPKRIEMISASTEAIQAQYVAPWLEANLTPEPRRTAVVLCNESMLQPVLHGLPEAVTELNVTKGFPLSHTEVVTLVERKMGEWERRQTKLPVSEMIARLTALVERKGAEYVNREGYSTEKIEDVLQGEAFYQMYTLLNRFALIMGRYTAESQMTIVTLRRLIRGVVRGMTVPFHGEPAVGLQIMGVLETRCLDFDRVIMLSVNDGVLPRRANDSSFIPFALRRAFGLTTPDQRTSVYAYNFYRLLQRAEKVTMTYNTSTGGMSTGEMSRFMTQLLVEWPHRVLHYSLNSDQYTPLAKPEPIAKPDDLVERLTRPETGHPTLSPSALKTYLECQLKFYFQSVMGIRDPGDQTDQIDPRTFGNLFHSAAELLYRPLMERGEVVEAEWLKLQANDEAALQRIVEKAFEEQREPVPYNNLIARVIELYLAQLMRRDAENGNFHLVGTERKAWFLADAEREGKPLKVHIKGTVDRADVVQTGEGQYCLRVLDYKTGAGHRTSKGEIGDTMVDSVEEIFSPGGEKAYIMQTFLYERMLRHEAEHDRHLASIIDRYPMAPALFFIRRAGKPGYNPGLRINQEWVTDMARYREEFDKGLKALLTEVLDPKLMFQPPKKQDHCPTCPYNCICWKTDDLEKLAERDRLRAQLHESEKE